MRRHIVSKIYIKEWNNDGNEDDYKIEYRYENQNRLYNQSQFKNRNENIHEKRRTT